VAGDHTGRTPAGPQDVHTACDGQARRARVRAGQHRPSGRRSEVHQVRRAVGSCPPGAFGAVMSVWASSLLASSKTRSPMNCFVLRPAVSCIARLSVCGE